MQVCASLILVMSLKWNM